MKNPFPGMNPYLEGHWGDVHARLTIYIADQLQDRLPAGLVARTEAQVAIDDTGERSYLRPDVQVAEPPSFHEPAGMLAGGSNRGSPNEPAGPLIIQVEPETHHWVEIREDRGRLVTVIEVLSPSNKNQEHRAQYLRRQRSYVAAGVNLVEIDLLRSGQWVLSVPESKLKVRSTAAYKVCVFRASQPEQREFYPIRLRDPLPSIRIPLRRSDKAPTLELQPLIDQVFERGRYLMLGYRNAPEPPLSADDDLWADTLLRKAGLRP